MTVHSESFQDLHWNLRNSDDVQEKHKSIRMLAARYQLSSQQIAKLLMTFDLSDRIEMFEVMLLSLSDANMQTARANILKCFHGHHRVYVNDIFKDCEADSFGTLASAEDKSSRKPQRFVGLREKQVLHRTKENVRALVDSIRRTEFTSNQSTIIEALVCDDSKGIKCSHVVYIMTELLSKPGDKELVFTTLEVLTPFILDVSCKDVIGMTDCFPDWQERLRAIRILCSKVVDPENEHRLAHKLGLVYPDQEARITQEIATVFQALPVFPSSSVFGEITSLTTVFVVDASEEGARQVATKQGELLTILRLVVRETCRVLKEHMKPNQQFNIVAINDGEVVTWCHSLVPATKENVDNACLFLRHLHPCGVRNANQALFRAFDMEAEVVHTLLHGVPFYRAPGFDNSSGNLQQHPTAFSTRSEAVGSDEFGTGKVVPNSGSGAAPFRKFNEKKQREARVTVLATELLEAYKSSRSTACVYFTGFYFGRKKSLLQDMVRYSNTVVKLNAAKGRVRPGMQRIVSLKTPLEYEGSLERFGTVMRQSIHLRVARRIQVTNFVVFMITSLLLALNRMYQFGSVTTLEVGSRFPTYITIPDSLFGMWKLSFLALGLVVIHLCHFARTFVPVSGHAALVGDGILSVCGYYVPLYCVFLLAWLFTFQEEQFITASVFGACTVITVSLLHQRVRRDGQTFGFEKEYLYIRSPVGFILAWTSYQFSLTLSVCLLQARWVGLGLESEWAPVVLSVLFIVAVIVVWRFSDEAYGITTIAVFAGIMWNNNDNFQLIQMSENVNSYYNMEYVLFILMFVFIAALSIVTLAVFTRRMVYSIAPPMDDQSAPNMVKRLLSMNHIFLTQASNIVCFVLLGLLFWGGRFVGYSTCASVATSLWADPPEPGARPIPLYSMPSNYAFVIWPILYGWLGLFFVAPMLLANEEVGSTLDKVNERMKGDADLGKSPFIRRPSTKTRFPAFWRWKLTWRASELLYRRISYRFAMLLVSWGMFIVCFRTGNFIASLAFAIIAFVLGLVTFHRIAAYLNDIGEVSISASAALEVPFGFIVGWMAYMCVICFEIVLRDVVSPGSLYLTATFRRDHAIVCAMVALFLVFVVLGMWNRSAFTCSGLVWAFTAVAVENLDGVCRRGTASRTAMENIQQPPTGLLVRWDASEEDCAAENNETSLLEPPFQYEFLSGKCRRLYNGEVCVQQEHVVGYMEFRDGVGVSTMSLNTSSWYCIEEPGICAFSERISSVEFVPPLVLGLTASILAGTLFLFSGCLQYRKRRKDFAAFQQQRKAEKEMMSFASSKRKKSSKKDMSVVS